MSTMPGDARIVPAQEPGVYYVNRDTWQVGARYELTKVLGSGSFSAVCLAWDRLEGEKVALKRVGDVFASPDYAKRVLREVCIMRRLEHPNIIRLKDVFLKPSSTGKYVFRGGRLVPTSFDCYMAMEYCDQGDLFNMRGQLPEHEVHSLMWQLLGALRYLHGLSVWHRDIKTGNLLLTLAEGRRVLKVADFGSARSAKEDGNSRGVSQDGGRPQTYADAGPFNAGPSPRCRHSEDGGASMDLDLVCGAEIAAATCPGGQQPPFRRGMAAVGGGGSDGVEALRAHSASGRRPQPNTAPAGGAGGLLVVPAPEGGYQPPLTSLVCTPCYRAPEVVMSRGGYSSAIDMWSAGCVFGELLQRAAYVGKASTPHLQVAPVFAVTGKPLTPCAGQHYAAAPGQDGSASAFAELSALFTVIGTPAWACIEGVRSDAWRRYLFHIPGRAPTLHRRFGQAGEVAVDLLARLLQFDPGRRASAEEAMAHEYFAMMHMEAQMEAAELTPITDGVSRTWRTSSATGRPGRPPRTSLYRRSMSPGEPESEAAATLAKLGTSPTLAPAAAAPGAPAWLPTWPPGRSTPPRHGVTGAGGGARGRQGDQDMDVVVGPEETKPVALTERVLVTATSGGCERHQGTSGGSCCTLLTKRKQLEEPSDGDAAGEGPPQRMASAPPQARSTAAGDEGERLRFWQMDEPALALAALEAELASLVPLFPPSSDDLLLGVGAGAIAGGPGAATATQTLEALAAVEECKERLRVMLERECEEHAARAASRRGAAQEERGAQSSAGGSTAAGSGSGGAVRAPGSFRRNSSDGMLVGPDGQVLGGAAALHGHLRPDPGQQLDPSVIGYERVPYHADASAARLEPEKHLSAGRHGEWTSSSLAAQRREHSPGTWGVTLLPVGLDEGTAAGKAYMKVLRSQHAR